jgi:hypothetical protein
MAVEITHILATATDAETIATIAGVTVASTSLGALCTDFYVNQRVGLTMDLPSHRESVLDLFGRIRKEMPELDRFRRYAGELALESPEVAGRYAWVALQRTSVRSGWVNPDDLDAPYHLHRLLLETAPYFLSITPLDVESIELVFGFDLEVTGNRNEIVFDALLSGSALAEVVQQDREHLADVQPFIALSLDEGDRTQASVEVKTRGGHREGLNTEGNEPLSVYLTLRRNGPFRDLKELPDVFAMLAGHAERMVEDRVIPSILMPLHARSISG